MSHKPKIVILGIGNLLLGDEGVGVHLAQMLTKGELNYDNVEIIDTGTSPEIASFVEGIDKLIIIDAFKGGGTPGTIYRFNVDDMNLCSAMKLSLHQVNIIDNLRILKLLGKQPKSTVVFGIEPRNMDWGLELSPEVEEKMPELKELITQEIKETR